MNIPLHIYRIILCLTIILIGTPPARADRYFKTHSYGIRDGLTSQHISAITQDQNGILWVGTWNGVAYFDGYRFTIFRGNSRNGHTSSNRFNEMLHDRSGNVWLLSFDRDIDMLDVATARFRNFRDIVTSSRAKDFSGKGFAQGADNHIWILGAPGTPSARIDVSGEISDKSVEFIPVSYLPFDDDEILKIEVDGLGNEWIFTENGLRLYDSDITLKGHIVGVNTMGDGFTYIISADGKIHKYNPNDSSVTAVNPGIQISGAITSLPYDSSTLLIGTPSGIVSFSTATGKAGALQSDSTMPARELYTDSRGRIWAFGPDARVALYPGLASAGRELAKSPAEKGTTALLNIWLEDRFGNVWLAPAGGEFCVYDDASSRLIPQIIKPHDFSTESVTPIEVAYVDNQHNLWFSSNHNLSVVSFLNENFHRAPMLENDEVRAVGRMADGTMLLGTSGGHLARFDSSGKFLSYLHRTGPADAQRIAESPSRIPFASKIYTIEQDADRNIWVGTKGAGLYMITPAGAVRTFRHNPADPYSLPCDTVYHLTQDNVGNIWVATYGAGVALARPAQDGTYRFINGSNDMKGYPRGVHDRVRRITSTPDGTVIASCTSGLLTFSNKFSDPSDIKFYSSRHIPGDSTSLSGDNVMQTLLAADGSIYVLPMGERIQKISSTDLLQDNLKFSEPYSGNNPHSILYATGSFGNSLSMVEDKSHNMVIVFEATIVVYDPSTGNAYTLASRSLGDHTEFTEALPALDPVTGNIWLANIGSGLIVAPDNVKVSPYTPRITFTGAHIQGEKETRSLLNPSELIIPPGQRSIAISFAALDYPDNSSIQYAYRLEGQPDWTYIDNANTVYLNDLTPGINRLYVRSTNADGIWQDNVTTLDMIIKPTFAESIWARIVYLLLGLGILFLALYIYTIYRKNQMIKEVHRKEREFFIEASHRLRTPLTLIGSPVAEVLETEQLTDTGRQHLARVHRNALEMLNLVNSMLKRDFDDTDNIDDSTAASYITPDSTVTSFNPDVIDAPIIDTENSDNEAAQSPDRTTILIVEDNKDLREFLHDILKLQYNVVTASNGRDGLRKAEKVQPDFIITDVTMPEMDGLTMVHNIKQNKSLSHIPIIVLSAKASVHDRVQGLREGIDDYITKPFSATYLRQRIASIITQRSILQQSYFEIIGREMSEIGAKAEGEKPADTPPASVEPQVADVAPDAASAPAEATEPTPAEPQTYHLNSPSITDSDQEMMDRLLKYIETRIADENLKIEELADAVNMGRTVFYGKIKALVGMSPSDFVRRLRMQRAEELIVRSKMNFSQIAYNVGFSDPKYFTKCFKKETGMTPSEYRQKSAL